MTEYKLVRLNTDKTSTIGMILAPELRCFTVEDGHREKKVAGETRIPPGRYEIKLRNEGGMTKRYANRFDYHKGMLHLQNVPGFTWIYIHVGNTPAHTEGCILVGDTVENNVDREGRVGRSAVAYERLYKEISGKLLAGEQVFITVGDK